LFSQVYLTIILLFFLYGATPFMVNKDLLKRDGHLGQGFKVGESIKRSLFEQY